jgi:hypothetical protein
MIITDQNILCLRANICSGINLIHREQLLAILDRLAAAERICALADPMKMADYMDDAALREAIKAWRALVKGSKPPRDKP